MKRFLPLWFSGTMWIGCLSGSGQDLQTVTPKPSAEPLLNPGKGWVLYGSPEDHRNGSLAYGATGYQRFQWAEIEPEEGRFDWSRIDTFLRAWEKEGKSAAFGVMCANIHHRGMYVTPEWVFDSGCKPRTVQVERPKSGKDVAVFSQYEGEQVIPEDWKDPVFLEKLEAFLRAMAARYDGDPRLAWYELRSYGNWGEGHLWPWKGKSLSEDEIFTHHIELHRKVFRKTPLIASWHFFESLKMRQKAAGIGIGVRDDGVMSYRDGASTAVCDGLAASCFEWGGTYQQLSKEPLWTSADRSLEACIRNGRVYYCGFARYGKEDIKAFLEGDRPLIDRLTNRLGYHLRITRITCPKTLRNNADFPFTLTWHNDGVARLNFPCILAVGILDSQNKIVSYIQVSLSKGPVCPGGEDFTEELTVNHLSAQPGNYRLAFALLRDGKPAVRLGLEGRTPQNWHPLAPVTVE